MLSAEEETRFWTLYRKTSEIQFRKAYRMCGGHQADAEDALQRTYLRVLEHWSTVAGLNGHQLDAWLATTLSREVLQIWRSPHRHRETRSDDDAAQAPAPAVPDEVEAIFAADRYRRICRAIAALEARQRDVMALHCLAGYDISEVAEMLGISQSTARVHLHRGRRRLREELAREEGQPDGQS